MRPAEHGQDAAFTQRDRRFETIAYLPRYWNFESIPLQRGVMQTIGSALGDDVKIKVSAISHTSTISPYGGRINWSSLISWPAFRDR